MKKSKAKKPSKAKEARKALRSADNTWRIAVNIKYDYTCAICLKDKTQCTLNAHHIISRTVKELRHDLRNGILLCASCHLFSRTMSAHKGSLAFVNWFIVTHPEDNEYLMNRLRDIELKQLGGE